MSVGIAPRIIYSRCEGRSWSWEKKSAHLLCYMLQAYVRSDEPSGHARSFEGRLNALWFEDSGQSFLNSTAAHYRGGQFAVDRYDLVHQPAHARLYRPFCYPACNASLPARNGRIWARPPVVSPATRVASSNRLQLNVGRPGHFGVPRRSDRDHRHSYEQPTADMLADADRAGLWPPAQAYREDPHRCLLSRGRLPSRARV